MTKIIGVRVFWKSANDPNLSKLIPLDDTLL